MEQKIIINYASGGLGNILFPLCSCLALSQSTGRRLILCWEPIFRCMATFKDIFEDDIEVIKKTDLLNYDDVKVFGNAYDINFDSQLYQNDSLLKVVAKNGVTPINFLHKNTPAKNVIIYHNDMLPMVESEKSIKALNSLKIKKEITSKAFKIINELSIDHSVFGAHARATDFNDGIEVYINKITTLISSNHDCKIFLCSDSEDWEQQLLNMFPKNILIRKKDHKVVKLNERNPSWSNNSLTPTEAVIEGLIDMIILSKTNFVVYNNNSSFARIVKCLNF